ncbi:MAG TPA: PEP-CTERM-box response regulator transcription factor [Vicinamibacteria bacterium]
MNSKPRLLVVDDDADLRGQMRWALADEFEVSLAGDREEALARARDDQPAVITLDLGLPPHPGGVEEGFATLEALRLADAAAKVVVITGREERAHALRAVDQGAYDFFVKPIDVEELKVVLRRALKLHALERENRELRQQTASDFEGMLGTSSRMQEVYASIRKVATVDAPVLVLGESGTGKELAAHAIHRLGARSAGPFVPINCGAIPEALLESELFGHEKGSFTGAHAQRRGRIETASGGTLFLDEIGELPTSLQVKLLRFLQDHKVERVGGRATIAVDVRVVTATNADLPKLLAEGRFREDLYYRIGVVTLSMPPLRDREDDVVMIAETFARRYAADAGRKLTGFAKDAVAAMRAHAWPGNVRELENRARRAAVMAEGPRITAADLELEKGATSARQGLRELRAGLERDTIKAALKRNRGNISQTATELGISRPTLYGLLSKFGIERP